MRKGKLKEALLEVQQQMFALQEKIQQTVEIKRERDYLFKTILDELSRLSKEDLHVKLEEDRTKFYTDYGKNWTVEQSFGWMKLWFDNLVEQTK